MKFKKQFDVLVTELNSENQEKSSYWQYFLRDFHVNEDLTINGATGPIGSFQALSPFRKILNNFFLLILLPFSIMMLIISLILFFRFLREEK